MFPATINLTYRITKGYVRLGCYHSNIPEKN